MSLELDVRVEAYCDGCDSTLHDGDYAYCKKCADADPIDILQEALDILDEWLYDNRLILSESQQKFTELMLESIRRESMPNLKELKEL